MGAGGDPPGWELPPAAVIAADQRIAWLARRLKKAGLAGSMDELRARAYLADYARRAGVEGTMHQATAHGARRARYRGLVGVRVVTVEFRVPDAPSAGPPVPQLVAGLAARLPTPCTNRTNSNHAPSHTP